MNMITCALDCMWQKGGLCTLEDTTTDDLTNSAECEFFRSK